MGTAVDIAPAIWIAAIKRLDWLSVKTTVHYCVSATCTDHSEIWKSYLLSIGFWNTSKLDQSNHDVPSFKGWLVNVSMLISHTFTLRNLSLSQAQHSLHHDQWLASVVWPKPGTKLSFRYRDRDKVKYLLKMWEWKREKNINTDNWYYLEMFSLLFDPKLTLKQVRKALFSVLVSHPSNSSQN